MPSRVWLTQTKDFSHVGELTKGLPENTPVKFGMKDTFCLKLCQIEVYLL